MNGFERREIRLCALVYIFEKLCVPKDLAKLVSEYVPINLGGFQQFGANCMVLGLVEGNTIEICWRVKGVSYGVHPELDLCKRCLRPVVCKKHWDYMEDTCNDWYKHTAKKILDEERFQKYYKFGKII